MWTPRLHHISVDHAQFHYALRGKIEQELQRLQAAGIVESITTADWAAPIVPILKPDGTIRICGDYKVTVNRVTQVDTYPLTRINDLFASLAGGKEFSKIDLAHAYQQIPLDESSKKLVVINTHKGLYQYNRLPFGVASAPAISSNALWKPCYREFQGLQCTLITFS